MKYTIRDLESAEYPLLEIFLYEALFQRKGQTQLPRSIINEPELQVYLKNFGERPDDFSLCAEADQKVIGIVWVRNIAGYGSVDAATPECAISLLKEYRGYGIGTELLQKMLQLLKEKGYKQVSLAVQKDNYALNMYQKIGFQIIGENDEEYLMIYLLK